MHLLYNYTYNNPDSNGHYKEVRIIVKSKPALTIIGRAARIQLMDYDNLLVIAKSDTGADISSIWASDIEEKDGQLSFVLFGQNSPYYSGRRLVLPAGEYRQTRVANSFGAKELRYVVKLRVKVLNRTVKASFTLAERSQKTYPVLLGRRFLYKKFLVNVADGEPLVAEEKEKRSKLHLELGYDQD